MKERGQEKNPESGPRKGRRCRSGLCVGSDGLGDLPLINTIRHCPCSVSHLPICIYFTLHINNRFTWVTPTGSVGGRWPAHMNWLPVLGQPCTSLSGSEHGYPDAAGAKSKTKISRGPLMTQKDRWRLAHFRLHSQISAFVPLFANCEYYIPL